MPFQGSYVWWRGGRFNKASIASLLRVEQLSGLPIRICQGGYNTGGVRASAGTHDGGGVVDVSVQGWSPGQRAEAVKWLRRCGWAAWVRTPAQGFVWHIHGVRIGDASAARQAQAQVMSYRNGRNGLMGNRPDTDARQIITTWEASPYNPANATQQAGGTTAKRVLVIGGKDYPDIGSVSVAWINSSRARQGFSRHTFYLQRWLSHTGVDLYRKDWLDGNFGPGTQKALDTYRATYMGLKGPDSQGDIGISSLTNIRDRVGSKRKVRVGK